MKNKIVSILFLIMLFIPMFGQAVMGRPTALDQENRAVASLPSFSGNEKGISGYFDEVSAWIMDNYGFREPLINVAQKISRDLKVRQGFKEKAIEGQEGWLFYAREYVIENYMGNHPFRDETELQRFVSSVKNLQQDVETRGGKFDMIAVPNKASLYPEFMPTQIPIISEDRRLSSLEREMERVGVNFGALTNALEEKKSSGALFLKLDTHWSELGAYYGYEFLLKRWQSLFQSELEPVPLREMEFVERTVQGGDLARFLEANTTREEITAKVVISEKHRVPYTALDDYAFMSFKARLYEEGPKEAPTLLLLGDSFSESLLPYLERHFSRIVFVHHQTGAFDKTILDEYPSDYVLVFFIERILREEWKY